MKKILALLTAMTMVLGMSACGGTTTGQTDGSKTDSAEKKLTVGYACKDINDTFQNYLIDAAKKYAEANNITLDVVDAQNDVVKQQDQVNTFITQGVDALIVLPIDTSACAPITTAAKNASIPLVYLNTNPYPDGKFPEGTYYCGSIEKEAGEMQAEYIGKLLKGEGKVCILQGSLTHEGAVQRTEGVVDKLKELYPKIQVLAKQPAEWQKDQAMNVTENWLTAYNKDIDAVFANNDEMALGAVNALQAAGKTKAFVIGIDGTKAGLEAIKSGKMAGSVFQDAEGQAKGAMELAISAARKEPVAHPIKWIPFQLITPENVGDYMK